MKSSWLALMGGLSQLGWVFLKVGIVFFGGGFVLIPLLHKDLVLGLHWMTEREFLDGVAVSQLTPGPVAILATFCGLVRGGIPGAIISTVAVFFPAFILMTFISHAYQKIGDTDAVRVIMDRVIPAIVGLLIAAAFQIGGKWLTDPTQLIILLVSLFVLIRWKIHPAILIGICAAMGLIFHY